MIVTPSSDYYYELDASYIFTCSSGNNANIGLLSTIYQAEQVFLPCVDLFLYALLTAYLLVKSKCSGTKKTPYLLLVPPILMFLAVALFVNVLHNFQGSSIASIIMLSQTLAITTGLLITRLTAIGDLVASSLIPLNIFVTNRDVRKEILYFWREDKKTPRASRLGRFRPVQPVNYVVHFFKMSGQEKPAVCSPSSRPKSPSSGQKEPDVEEDPLELAFQEVAKYLDILPPQAATALKGRMVESHQRFLKHKELEKEAERIYAILGGNTANGRILGGLLETNKRAEQMMADLAEETRQAWIQLGLTEYNGPTEESNRE